MDANVASSSPQMVNGEKPKEVKVPRETDPVCTGPTVQVDSKGFCWVGNIAGKGCDPVRAAAMAMNQLKDVLSQNGYSMSNVSAVSLYMSDMGDYTSVNAEYVKFFGANPPIRVCVEAPLPESTPVFLEALAHKKTCDTDPAKCRLSCSSSLGEYRQNMHVQGISHWAPANIGPYSQAIRVDEILYLAGQIGLVPGNMQMVEGGMKVQCKLALRHMGRIVRAMDPKTQLRDVVQGICYVTDHSYIEEARREWEKRTNNAIVDYVVVPHLPRGALVEWHIWAHIYNSRFEYEETGCYVKEKVKVTLQRRWNYENNVAAIVCRATVGSEEDVIEEDSLGEVVRYALRKLMKGAESNATSFLRVFYRVGRLSPRQMEAVLQEMSEFRFAYSVIPSCGLLHQRTLLSICGARHE